jgi:hypothetical protein
MPSVFRQFLVCLIAYVVGLILAVVAMLGVVDLDTVSLNSGLPTVAMLTPMIAVIGFWAVVRMLGIPLNAMRTFLFGAIAIYSLLYLCGRLVANAVMADLGGLVLFALTLFGFAYILIRTTKERALR